MNKQIRKILALAFIAGRQSVEKPIFKADTEEEVVLWSFEEFCKDGLPTMLDESELRSLQSGIELVKEFHQKFDFADGSQNVLSSDSELQLFRLEFLKEEMNELRDALYSGDRVGAFDALLDLVYVAHGTALYLGISPDQWKQGEAAVHEANMAKIRVQQAEESKRGSTFDVRKPEGWVAPEGKLKQILGE